MPIKIRLIFFMLISIGLLTGCRAPRLSQLYTNATATPSASMTSAWLTVTPTTHPTASATIEPTANVPTPFPTITPTPFPKNVFDNFRNSAGYCNAKTMFGRISPGQTIEEPVIIDGTVGQAWFSLSWPGTDELGLTLSYPDGTVVDPSFPNGHEINEKFTSKPGRQEYFFRSPETGQWVAKISNKAALAKESDYKFVVSLSTAMLPYIDFDKTIYAPNETMQLSITLLDDYLPLGGPSYVTDAVIKVIVEDPAQNQSSFELYDDGTHGDQKAGDGKYINSFDKTTLPGIYKFVFQMSGHNVRAGEPFIRECFLAQTVKAIQPTATPVTGEDEKVCKGTTQVSEPLIVRAENVAGNDSSEYSRFAFDPQGVSTGAGILVIWHMGYLGVAPQPNVYMRLLDDNAQPIGDVGVLFKRNWSGQKAYSLISKGNDALLTYFGRFDDTGKSVSALLDSEGHLRAEELRLPNQQPSYRDEMQGAWTGTHFLFASTGHHFVETNVVRDLVLETADENGQSISSKILMTLDGPLDMSTSISIDSLVVGHERILLTISRNINGQNHIFIYPFDLEGNQLGEPVILDPPLTYEQQGKILTGNFGRTYTVPTTNGWMVVIPSVGEGIYIANLHPDGSLISSPKLIDNTLTGGDGFVDAIPYHNGIAILTKSPEYNRTVIFVSSYGNIPQTWNIPGSNSGSLLNHKGRLFMVYASGAITRNPETNQVLIRELQCAP